MVCNWSYNFTIDRIIISYLKTSKYQYVFYKSCFVFYEKQSE